MACSQLHLPNFKRALYYNRSQDMGYTWEGWVFVDSIRTVCPDMSVSASGKVAFAWTHPLEDEFTSPVQRVNNDIYYVISQDGGTPDFSSPINVTDFENSAHPNSDSLRAFEDISLLYDEEENLHLLYTCTGYIDVGSHHKTTPGSKIYHYSDASGFTYITGELSGGVIPFENRRMYDRPSLSYSQSTDELYAIWNQFDDWSDTSSAGFVNGEVWGAFSEDGGASWSAPVNITATESPGANPGDCLSEDYPSITRETEDTLRIAYILDREPGVNLGEYPSDVIYHKAPIEDFKNAASVENKGNDKVVENFRIINSYPNPFNPLARIEINLRYSLETEIKVYNIQGGETALIHRGLLSSGAHSFIWDASHLPAGIYFVRLESGSLSATHKLLLLK